MPRKPIQNAYQEMPPYCGTPSTPPCPPNAFLRTRTELAFQLTGGRPTPERLRIAAARIDRFLIETIRSLAVFEATANPGNRRAYDAAKRLVKSRARK